MLAEIAAAHGLFVFTTLLGLPLALLSVPENRSDTGASTIALLLSPALGGAIIALIAYPLYIYLGPVRDWGSPIAFALAGVSAFSGWVLRRKLAFGNLDKTTLSWAVLALLFGSVALSVAPITGGLDRVVFVYNPSDAISYLTLAESIRLVPLETLWAGRLPTASSESATLLRISDTALYSARFLDMPARLATVIDLAWFSTVSAIPIERLLYVFGASYSLAAIASGVAVLRALSAPAWMAAVGALVIGIGPWATAIRDHDATSQAQLLPVLIGLVGVRIVLSKGQGLKRFVLPAFAAAGAVCIYTEYTVVLIAWLLGEASLFLVRFRRFDATVYEPVLILGCAAGALFAFGELSYHASVLMNQFRFVAAAPAIIGSTLFDPSLARAPFAVLAGAGWLLPSMRAHSGILETISGFAVAGTMVAAMWAAFFASRHIAAVAGLVLLTAALSIYALLLKGDPYILFKILATGYFSVFVLLLPLSLEVQRQGPRLAFQAISMLSVVLVATQLGYALQYTGREIAGDPPHYALKGKTRPYDVQQVVDRLAELQPKNLMLYIPPDERWWNSAILIFPFKSFAPFHQAGYLVDNNMTRLPHHLMIPSLPIDYAVVCAEDDYLEGRETAAFVWEGQGLRIYKVLEEDEAFREFRSRRKSAAADIPLHGGLPQAGSSASR